MHWLDELLRAIEKGAAALRPEGGVEVRVRTSERRGGAVTGYNFTERVRKVLALAREESARLHHEYVGTEHILFGLIREGEGVASAVLQNLSVDADALRKRMSEIVKEGQPGRKTGPELPYTSRAKKVLELAMSEARELSHSYVGTEHLLLGLLREEKGIAAQMLAEGGLSLDAARAETLRVLGTEIGAEERTRREAAGARGGIRMRSVPATPPPAGARPPWPAAASMLNRAEVRRLEAEAAKTALETDWLHVRNVIELGERTGTPVRLEPAADGVLWLVLGDNLVRARVPGSAAPPAEPPDAEERE